MTAVWDKIESLASYIEQRFDETGVLLDSPHEYTWYNKIYTSTGYRRAHIEIVDFRATHKIYILHCTIFPNANNPAPIWGFDAVCGASKITGAFHDFSWAGGCTEMESWFADRVRNIEWNKPRELPEWARKIFSPSMVAAGNVQAGAELDGLVELAKDTLDYYLANVHKHKQADVDSTDHQNNYCYWQKQNPHVVRSMVAMGVPEDTMRQFVNEILFPEIS
jgi:hypothetical protein